MARVLNFNAGPAALPLAALEKAQQEMLDWQGTGMSLMEHSHRGKDYDALHQQTIALMRELLSIPEDYHVMFLQGGASQQFAVVPMNLLPAGKSADYVVTGAWGQKAFSEAKNVGTVRLAATTEDNKAFVRVPKKDEIKVDPNAAYLHFTSNETIHGVQFHDNEPDAGGVPLVCDMSSDFMWRKFDVKRYSLIYAGAQKNIGPAGVTVVIARKDLVEKGRTDIPKIFRYSTQAGENSMYNTCPTFGIYMIRNVMQWIKDSGGLDQIEKWNREKAKTVYDFLDAHGSFYRAPVQKDSRSVMNIVFRLPTEDLEAKLIAEAKKAGMVGLKGHRSVGGIRISAYNAVSLEAVSKIVAFMETFAKANG
ncbi:MAG: 3-phosphoserine/phosphohydroxythreonine transaminase [Deltaproteobacteria bacterium]|nr:3-phosphoserine/phosphohydroxythreonine transaminase [Deltaproteobacteria bacterium]